MKRPETWIIKRTREDIGKKLLLNNFEHLFSYIKSHRTHLLSTNYPAPSKPSSHNSPASRLTQKDGWMAHQWDAGIHWIYPLTRMQSWQKNIYRDNFIKNGMFILVVTGILRGGVDPRYTSVVPVMVLVITYTQMNTFVKHKVHQATIFFELVVTN